MSAPVELAIMPLAAPQSDSSLRKISSFRPSLALLVPTCAALVALLGYLDYCTGYEQPLLLFYLIPIACATWFGGLLWGLGFSGFSLTAWIVSDLFAGLPALSFWNLAMALAAYIVFAFLLAKLKTLLGDLEDRVRERTKALRREMAERQRLDREIAQVADRERRRLGQELHDSLCQHLTGTALTAQTLREKLAARSAAEIAEADKVVRYIEEGIDLSRDLARGFFSPELEPEGLVFALQSLAENVNERFQIPCAVEIQGVVDAPDSTAATHLYRIAQEAVTNAAKHANPSRVQIRLAGSDRSLILSVSDDGVGLPDKLPQTEGLGFRLMTHGAAILGADFHAARNPEGGTTVTCKLNMDDESE